MRILTVTNMYPTEADPTIGTFVGDQVQALRRHPRVECCEVLFINGARDRRNYLRGPLLLRRAMRKRRFDVVLAHYGLTGAVAVTQRSAPVVITYHAGDVLGDRWQLMVSRIAYRFAADAISVSVDGLAALPGPAHHLTCGIDLKLFTPRPRAPARERFGVEPGELAVLFPSSPHRVFKKYPRFVAVLDELRARGHRVHELQLRGLSRSEVPELMAAADVMALTSSVEAAPVAVMEALACGLSVVATPVAELPSMLGSAAHARVLPFDAVAFADAVEELVRIAPAERAPDPDSRRFDEDAITDRLVEILEAAGARSARRGLGPLRWSQALIPPR
jgi:glycosyltransferase involved in cell wall biosynthesis